MEHKVISVDDPESLKESVLDVIQWTQATLAAELLKECERCRVNEDAGVAVRLLVMSQQTPDAVTAWIDLPITFTAEPVYKPRLDAAARALALRFKVEQYQYEYQYGSDQYEITNHRLAISYLYPA